MWDGSSYRPSLHPAPQGDLDLARLAPQG
jgi:hypothetical protein